MTRRALLAGGLVLALGVAGAEVFRRTSQQSSRSAPSSWPMAAHDLAATRRGAEPSALSERWRARLAGGIPATAAIAEGVVYAASARGAVAAFSLRDGQPLWRQELDMAAYEGEEGRRELGFFGGVAVDPAGVLVASDRVHCLNRETGRTLWSTDPLRTGESDDYFWGPPAVADGTVLVGSGSGGERAAGGRLSAYRLADGAPLWSTATVPAGANGGGIIGQASVDLERGLAYVSTGAPYETLTGPNPGTCSLLALRLRDGTVVWRDQVHRGDARGFDFNSAPVLLGRLLFAANKDGIYAWDRLDRRRLWHRRLTDPLAGGATAAGPTSGPEGGPLATDGRRVYALSNDVTTGGCAAAALAPRDGRVLWRAALPAPTFAAPALGGRRLYIAGSDGTLRVLNTETGALAATAPLEEPSAAAPAIAGGRLVVGTGAEPYLPGSSLVCLG